MAIEQTPSTQHTAWLTLRRLPFEAAYDLLFLSMLALLLPLILWLPVPLLRVPLGLAMALLAPGYALTAALFPRRDEVDGPIRAALSFGLSAGVIPLLALILDRSPWGIHPLPITIALASFIVVASCIALVRRSLLPLNDVALPYSSFPGDWWRDLAGSAQFGIILAALALLFVLGAGAYALAAPDPSAQVTEFYVLGRAGLAEDYPRQAVVGQDVSVTMGVANKESSGHRYRVEVWVTDAGGTGQRTLAARQEDFTLAAGEQRKQPMSWRMTRSGSDQQIDLLLFIDSSAEPYRMLRLWLNVVEQ